MSKEDLRNRVAADIFTNSIAHTQQSENIYNTVRSVADSKGKDVGVYLSEFAVKLADCFVEVLNTKGNRING